MFTFKIISTAIAIIGGFWLVTGIMSDAGNRRPCQAQIAHWDLLTATNNSIRSQVNGRYFAVELAKTRLACGLPGETPIDEVPAGTIPDFVQTLASTPAVIDEARQKMDAAEQKDASK